MAAPPTVLIADVKTLLGRAATVPNVPELKDAVQLHRDLGIGDDLGRKALAAPFQKIAEQHRPSAVVTRDECAKLETVKDSISLVAKKAGFEYEGER